MQRFAYRSLTGGCVIAIASLAILWAITRTRSDTVFFIFRDGLRISVATHPGGITFLCTNSSPDDGLGLFVYKAGWPIGFGHDHFNWYTDRPQPAADDAYHDALFWWPPYAAADHTMAGFGWEAWTFLRKGGGPVVWLDRFDVPFWFAATIAVATATVLWMWNRRQWRRDLNGQCRRCGYDLRATPGRCPECGTAAST